MKTPCFGCTERTQKCHIDCERYAEYKYCIEERRKERNKDYDAREFYITGCEKRKRERFKKR